MIKRSANAERGQDCIANAAVRPGGLSGWLVRNAAQAAPAELASRLEEEWRADLATRSTSISRLRFALGCLWATRVITHDYASVAAPVGAPAWMARAMAAPDYYRRGVLSRRTVALGLVAILHLGVFYALMTGLSSSMTKPTAPPLQNQVLSPSHPQDPLPLPPPNLNRVRIEAPRLAADVTVSPDIEPEVIRADPTPTPTPEVTQIEAPVAPQHVARVVQGGPGVGFPTADDFYPSVAKRLGEEGIATVRVCVNSSGRLTSVPSLVTGSGSARLDDAAVKLAGAGSGHYRAMTEDGHAVDSCFPFRIRFQIKN